VRPDAADITDGIRVICEALERAIQAS